MHNGIHTVTVYCSSSKKVAAEYFAAAEELGRGIGRFGWKLVYGGNHVGMMGALADGARAGGAKVVGITPQLLVDKGIADTKCDELVVTEGMRERKALLEQRGDAFVALPGGIGTLDEIIEVLVGRFLGYHNKPIVVLNVGGYYGPLLEMLRHGTEQHFIRQGTAELIHVAGSVEDALQYLRHYPATSPPKGAAQTPVSGIE